MSLVLISCSTLLTYLKIRGGKFPRGPLDEGYLHTLKTFVGEHPDIYERCGITEAEVGVFLDAVDGVQDGGR